MARGLREGPQRAAEHARSAGDQQPHLLSDCDGCHGPRWASAKLRQRFAAAAAAERAEVARELTSLGVGHVVLSTEGDWLRPLAQHLRRHGGRR